MNKKVKWIGAIAGAFALTFCAGAYTCVQASADDTAEFWKGFAITATAVRTDDPVGLRFKTDVERLTPTMKKYNPNAEYYTTLTLTTGGKTWTTTRYADVWRPDGSGWNTVLLGIPESDYATEITAQSFIKLNGSEMEFFQTEPVTISITQTAAAAMSYGATQSYITQYVENDVSSLTLDKTSATLEEGQTIPLNATTSPVQCMAKWTSSDTSVATVDAKGNVKAKSVGETTITAQINGYTATCQVTVTGRDATIDGFANTVDFSRWGSRKFSISATWLNNVFADERIDAFTFKMKPTANMTLKAFDDTYQISLTKNTEKTETFTRTMYNAWRASGAVDLTITSSLGTISTGSITFSGFQKVWTLDESETLTKSELTALDGAMPEYLVGKEFDFYGYSNPSEGKWTIDGVEYSAGEDFRTVERYEEYKEAGMSIFFPQTSAQINFSFNDTEGTARNSWNNVKVYYDRAYAAGLKKGIFNDERLRYLSIQTHSLVGEGKTFESGDSFGFATQAELDAYVAKCLSLYIDHPLFYGVYLQDEPRASVATAYGETYAAIQRVAKSVFNREIFVQFNLNPLVSGWEQANEFYPAVDGYNCTDTSCSVAELKARFAAYLNLFLDTTGADHICYDHYPLQDGKVRDMYILGLQVAAGICEERNVEFHFVAQTCKMDSNGKLYYRAVSEEDARWINNMLLGFGVKNIAYYTYWTKGTSQTNGEYYYGEGSFMTHYGEKTDIYYYMREITSENQTFANTILSFNYQSSAVYTASTIFGSDYITNCEKGSFAKLAGVSVNTESALITELYESNANRYMYMAQNVVDPTYQATQTVQLQFNENYQYAIVWKNGEKSVVRLDNNKYIVKLNAGEAVYVIPFNPERNDGIITDVEQDETCVWFPVGDNAEFWNDGLLVDTEQGETCSWFPTTKEGSIFWKEVEELAE